jgi:hypothetical protein
VRATVQPRQRALPLASRTRVSSLLVWRAAQPSSSLRSTRVEVLKTRALAGPAPPGSPRRSCQDGHRGPRFLDCFASSSLVPFFLSCFVCWTEGAAGRRRMPLTRRHPGLPEACFQAPHEGSSVRTHSAFNRGVTPLQRSSPCRRGPSVLVLRLVPSPIIARPSNAPTAPPVQPNPCHLSTFPQPTAPCVTAPASATAFPPTMQVPRRTPRSLSLGSLGLCAS